MGMTREPISVVQTENQTSRQTHTYKTAHNYEYSDYQTDRDRYSKRGDSNAQSSNFTKEGFNNNGRTSYRVSRSPLKQRYT